MYAPQVFHGMSGEVSVPESSKVRERLSRDRPSRVNASRYMRPGSAIAMYWSAVNTLVPTQVTTVVLTSAPVPFTPRTAKSSR